MTCLSVCRWFDTGRTGFHWHCVNGWETEDNKVVLYMPLFDSYPSSMPIHIANEPESRLHKFVLDLESGELSGGLVEATKVQFLCCCLLSFPCAVVSLLPSNAPCDRVLLCPLTLPV